MSENEIPNPLDFYLKFSLYKEFAINEQNKKKTIDIIMYDGTLDSYCIDCKHYSIFKTAQASVIGLKLEMGLGVFAIGRTEDWLTTMKKETIMISKEFRCTRKEKHLMCFYIMIKKGKISKIGQTPSITNLNEPQIVRFRKTLGDDLYKEFNRAFGLYSHGVGVGSFVYLRRIIENFIIKPAYEQAKKQKDWNDEEYQRKRIQERIEILKPFLPEYLISNKGVYSIISKGIHELSEEECMEYFPVLHSCIEFVLAEFEAKIDTEKKKQELTKEISKIAARVK